MSEHQAPGNGNFTNNQELSPREVERAYYDLGSTLRAADIPDETFEEWETVLERNRLDPDRQMTQAWIYLEHAFGISQRGDNLDTIGANRVDDYFMKSREVFLDIAEKTSNKRELRSQAEFVQSQLQVLHAIISDNIEELREGLAPAYAGQLKMAKELEQRYRRFKNIADVPRMQALATEMLFISKTAESIFTFPAPPRAVNPSNPTDEAWSFFVFDIGKHQGVYKGRVAATGVKGFLTIPPALLRNDGYPSKNGQGLLQAFIDDDSAHRAPLVYKNSRFGSRHPAHGFINETRDGLIEHLNATMSVRRAEGGYDEPEKDHLIDPLLFYLDIPAVTHASLIPDTVMDTLISHCEVEYQGDELSPREAFVLGSMHLDVGFGEVITGKQLVGEYGTFDRAEDIFGEVATKSFAAENERALGYEALFYKSAAQLYKALAAGERDGADIEEASLNHQSELADIAAEALEDYMAIDDKTTEEAQNLKLLLDMISVCLTSQTGTGGGAVATLCTMRQRGLTTDNNQGWHVSVWPLTASGYRPNYHGRIRLGPESDENSLNHGVVTIPTSIVDDDEFSTLRYVIDVIDGNARDDAPRQYQELVEAIIRTTEIADW